LEVPGPAVIEYFEQVADAIHIPVMVQDAPLSPTPLPVSLLTALVQQVPQVQYAKIEVPQAADKLHALVTALGDGLPGPFDGEESVTLIPDLDAGARGTMPSSMVPAELGRIVRRYRSGDRAGAVSAWEDLLPLIHFENRQCGLRAQKILLAEGGITASDRTRDVQIAARHADPRTHDALRPGPQEPRPPPELHPGRLHGLWHLINPASPVAQATGDARPCRDECVSRADRMG
jgi:dihydrodipicolinate synthase/N-acetylneuraminate lyase